MKRIILLAAIYAGLLITGCKKKNQSPELIHAKVTVVQDCAAVYLKMETDKIYRLCNFSTVESFKSDAKVSVVYALTNNCTGGLKELSCYKMPLIDDGITQVFEITAL